MERITDVNISRTLALPSPVELCRDIPRTESDAEFVAVSRDVINGIIFGNDRRFLVVVGPCSIHDTNAGREYAERLAVLARELADRLFLVMRVYFEKPRTTIGWKGLIMDPHLDGTADIGTGLRIARRFLLDVIRLGLPTATELLDPITPQYIADLICWSAIGARTTESQTHRQMASGLSMPLGFKNTTSGAILPAINAIRAATLPQTFLGVTQDGVAAALTTTGNPNCHIILRGGDDRPNYDAYSVAITHRLLAANHLPASILIDAAHANSRRDHTQQPAVFREIVHRRASGTPAVIGAMLESNLLAGCQPYPRPREQLVYGQSITDPCIDWPTTEALLREAYQQLGPAD